MSSVQSGSHMCQKKQCLLWYLQDGAALSAKRAVCVVESLLKEQQDLTAWLSLPALPPAAAGSAGRCNLSSSER